MLHSRVVAKFDGKEIPIGDFAPSESITVGGKEIQDFTLHEVNHESVHDAMCTGQRVTLTGIAASLRKTIAVTTCAEFPQMAIFEVQYTTPEAPFWPWTAGPISALHLGRPGYRRACVLVVPEWILREEAGLGVR